MFRYLKTERIFWNMVFTHFLELATVTLRKCMNTFKRKEFERKSLSELETVMVGLFNGQEKVSSNSGPSKYIILDYFPAPEWLIPNSITAQLIRHKFGGKIVAFNFHKPYKNTSRLYSAAHIRDHLNINLNFKQFLELRKLFTNFHIQLKESSQVFNYEIDGIAIGIDIYESILREGFATVKTGRVITNRKIYLGFMQYIFFLKLFENNRIMSILVSHDAYIGGGILTRMSHKFGIPVLVVDPFQVSVPFQDYQLWQRFRKYPEYFKVLSPRDQSKAIGIASSHLNMRINGALGAGISNQLLSAFEKKFIEPQILKSEKLKVLIATHCYFDNPQAYSKMLFADFFLWLEFLSDISRNTNYDWYIKPHRDYKQWELDEIKKYVSRNPHIKIIDSDCSFHQLATEGLDFALTCHGTIGHELPLLGINVLNASFNPHIAYSFNHHAQNIEEYRRMLLNLESLRRPNFYLQDLYEFYYVHHHILQPDSFNFPSYKEYRITVGGNVMSNEALDFIIMHFDNIAKRVLNNVDETLSSRRVFSTEAILAESNQQKVPLTEGNRYLFQTFID